MADTDVCWAERAVTAKLGMTATGKGRLAWRRGSGTRAKAAARPVSDTVRRIAGAPPDPVDCTPHSSGEAGRVRHAQRHRGETPTLLPVAHASALLFSCSLF